MTTDGRRTAPTRVVGDLLRERATSAPDDVFVVCGPDRLTFGEADRRTDRIAAGLASLGVRRGDRVAFLSGNRLEFVEAFCACAKLGAVQVPLNVFLKGEFLHYQLADSEASVILVDEAGARAVSAMTSELPELRRLVCFDDTGEGASFAALRECADPLPDPDLSPADLLSIVYTSGTTGMPKGCMLPHGYYSYAPWVSRRMMDYSSDDIVYTALPLYHGWARGILGAALVHGLTAVIDPVFSPAGCIDRLAETGATAFCGVGMMGMALLATPPTAAEPLSLRAALMIPFAPDDQRRFEARFGGTVVSQMYGQTECGAITQSVLGEEGNRASVGRPAPNYEVRLVDDDDVDVEPGTVGEVVVRPTVPNAMYRGYWRKPGETVRAWRNLWHHTGDYAVADAEGWITFVDRKADALRRRGENVSSLQLEAAISAHPKVAECAVHAVPSPMTEDDVKVCVVVAGDDPPTPEELFAFFRDALPYFAIPRYVELVDELPRNATMRVMKHLLRERGVTADTWDLETMGLVVERAERR